ncbi:hypothetical protein ElyMa_005579600 [Elysia marginata]|uniref:Uncharacterized protein n=1 Tax=Elysia marginata TaxID=1093978 RepID=A0AAV4F2X1_9GAST|nr:hypothetical protein ElyMa_005579600 [Elysia marginata]
MNNHYSFPTNSYCLTSASTLSPWDLASGSHCRKPMGRTISTVVSSSRASPVIALADMGSRKADHHQHHHQ